MTTLVLGTAQWGAGYGITNQIGRLSDDSVAEIARLALTSGVSSVDTAAGYGDAESRLSPWANSFRITTKIPGKSPDQIPKELAHSLRHLGRDSLDGCLIHDWDVLSDSTRKEAAQALKALQDEGLIASIGTSVYDADGIRSTVECFAESLGLIQVPANAIDRRLDENECLLSLNQNHIRVQVRSVFLQGLLLDSVRARAHGHPSLVRFHDEMQNRGLSAMKYALSHVRSLDWAGEIVVGVTGASELTGVLNAFKDDFPVRADSELASADEQLIDPRKWASA